MKTRITPRAARVVNSHRLVDFDFAVHRFRRRERDLAERHSDFRMQFAEDVNLARVRQRIFDRMNRIYRICGAELIQFHFVHSVNSVCKKKPCAERRMADLASFGGITRIRFKGSPIPPSLNRTLSHSAPPHLILGQNKTETTEVNARYPVRPDRALPSKLPGGLVAAAILSSAPRSQLPLLCSYEKWRAIGHSPISKRTRRCRCRTYPFHPLCPRPSPYRS
jgi:hypothetical protein